MALQFDKTITTREQLRSVLREPSARFVAKVIDPIDDHSRGFIARAPFLLLATAKGQGKVDVSPKGDPSPGWGPAKLNDSVRVVQAGIDESYLGSSEPGQSDTNWR